MNERNHEMAKEQLIADFNTMVHETEKLLKSMSNGGGETISALHAKVEQMQSEYNDMLRNVQHTAVGTTMDAARATNHYVHQRPWQSIGIAAGVALIAGMTAGLLLNDR